MNDRFRVQTGRSKIGNLGQAERQLLAESGCSELRSRRNALSAVNEWNTRSELEKKWEQL